MRKERTAKRLERQSRQAGREVELNIVSLIDIFAMLVFYLLVNALVVQILPNPQALKLPESVVVARDIATTGNTSAASIPLATHRLLEEHPELSGGLALQIGFGAGLVFGAQVVRLP